MHAAKPAPGWVMPQDPTGWVKAALPCPELELQPPGGWWHVLQLCILLWMGFRSFPGLGRCCPCEMSL